MAVNITEVIRKMMGWCPNAAMLNKKEEIYMVSYEGNFVDKIRGMGFRGFLSILHLVFGVWLIITALRVLAKPLIFPWWIMNINIFSSGILLVAGICSLMIFINFMKSANIHRKLALVNISLFIVFFLYLSTFLISGESVDSVFERPYWSYSFGFVTLILFTLIIGIPSILTFFSKPSKETKSGYFRAALLILIITFASLGGYYLYLNNHKDATLVEEFGENNQYKLYGVEPGSILYYEPNLYFLDSAGDTTGHLISEDTYNAIKFLKSTGNGKVLAWWDFELEIKAAGKEPVISYASEAIKTTIARPASLFDKFEPDEKVADVSRFFTTDSEDVAKSIAEKYGADIVYVSRQRFNDLIGVMIFAADPNSMQKQDIKSPDEYFEKIIKPTMANKFNTGADLKYFEKVFENKDVIIYELK